MRIGILGCGYIGEAAALHWKEQGHIVTATTRHPNRIPHLQTIADHVFLLNSPLEEFLAKQEALLIAVAPDTHSDYAATYLQTAQQVANTKSPSLKHILYTSSLSVYGDHQGNWVDENTPPSPIGENGRILLEAEEALRASHTPTCIFRLGEIYGPGREIEQRIRRTIHSPFPGDGSSYTNLTHQTDCVRALDFALKNNLQGIYNLCGDYHVPRRLFYEEICKKENLPPVQWDPTRKSLHAGNRRASNSKLKDAGFAFE